MNRKISLKNMEWSILICVGILIAIGCVALYSATQSTGHEELTKQLIWLGISLPIMVIFIVLDYELILKIVPILYLAVIRLINCSIIY